MKKYKGKKIKYALILVTILVAIICIPYYFSSSRYKYSVNLKIGMDQKVTGDTTFHITYVLNGGTQGENAPTRIEQNETVTLPTPTKTDYVFLGWYDNENYTGTSLTELSNVTGNVTLYAKWIKENITVTYKFGDSITFDGATAINTSIEFFSSYNIDREMEVTLDIDEHTYLTGQTGGYNTFFNCADHAKSPWPGFTFRANSSKYFLKTSNKAGTSRRRYTI